MADICIHAPENNINGCELVLEEGRRLPEDGTLVPKHVGVGTYHELCFIICILLYCIECICWLIY